MLVFGAGLVAAAVFTLPAIALEDRREDREIRRENRALQDKIELFEREKLKRMFGECEFKVRNHTVLTISAPRCLLLRGM